MHNIIDEKFWLAIAFFAFVTLILKYVWPILSQKISEQSKQIAKELLEAQELKEEAKKLLEDSKKQYENSVIASKKLFEDAESEAKKLLEDVKVRAAKDFDKKVAALNERIKTEEEKAIRDLKKEVVSLAFDDIKNNLQNNNQEKSVDNSLDDISKII